MSTPRLKKPKSCDGCRAQLRTSGGGFCGLGFATRNTMAGSVFPYLTSHPVEACWKPTTRKDYAECRAAWIAKTKANHS